MLLIARDVRNYVRCLAFLVTDDFPGDSWRGYCCYLAICKFLATQSRCSLCSLLLSFTVCLALRIESISLKNSLEELHVLWVTYRRAFIVNKRIKLFLEQVKSIAEVLKVILAILRRNVLVWLEYDILPLQSHQFSLLALHNFQFDKCLEQVLSFY